MSLKLLARKIKRAFRRRNISGLNNFRKFNFRPRVRLPNYELENSEFDFSLFTSLQRQALNRNCTQHNNINKQNAFLNPPIFSSIFEKNLNSIKITKNLENHENFVKHQSKLHDLIARFLHVILKKIKNSKIWDDSRVRHSKLLELNTNNHVYYSCHSFRKYRNYSRYIKSSTFKFIQV